MLTSEQFKWNIAIFIISCIVLLNVQCHQTHNNHKEGKQPAADEELRRTKRNVYQALLKKRYSEKREKEYEYGIPVNNVYTTTARPFIEKQVQNASVQLRLAQEWRLEMLNITSPEFQLLAGNAKDAIANEFIANSNYISSKVTKLRPSKDSNQIIADITITFFKTENNPISLLQNIVTKGWVGGQEVDPNFFNVKGMSNSNQEPSQWHYTHDIGLNIRPAMKAPDNVSHFLRTHKNLTVYKEIRISIKLKQRFTMFLRDRKTPEYSSLSGNVEEAIMKVFVHDALFFDAEVLEFRESPEGRVIVRCALQFKVEEKYAIEKCQAMISSGDLEGMPVDDRYFVVDALSEYGTNIIATNGTRPTISTAMKQPVLNTPSLKPKPLRYKDLRVTIKLRDVWRPALDSNETSEYAVYSGNMESAVDRSLGENPNYIDATVLEFLESQEHQILLSLSIRFKLEEKDPERKFRDIISSGSLSGNAVDPSFFYVFALSETTHPNMIRNQTEQQPNQGMVSTMGKPARNQTNTASQLPAVNTVNGPPIANATHTNNTTTTYGQKQPAGTTIPLINKVNNLRPTYLLNANQTTPKSSNETRIPINNQVLQETQVASNPAPITTTNAPIPLPQSKPVNISSPQENATPTFNPYLPVNTPGKPTFNPYLPVNTQGKPTFNPYLPVNTQENPSSNKPPTTSQYKPTTPLSQGGNNTVEGSMILEEAWRPELADKSGQFYQQIEKSVVSAIQTVYAEANETVTPKVLGFSETNVPGKTFNIGMEKKVGVRFKVLFQAGYKADAAPLERSTYSNHIASLSIRENTLAVVASSKPTKGDGTDETQLSLCQEQQKEAEMVSEGSIGGFIPQCNSDGSYKPVQCHALTGYCWCVSKVGVRVQGSEEKYKEPNCEGTKFYGRVILPEHSPHTLLANSCMTIAVQEMVSCGGNVSCHIPLVANKTFENLNIEEHSVKYELNTPQLKPGKYSISAIINVGWCRKNSYFSKDLIHPGDYHTAVTQDVTIETDTRVINQDIQVDVMLPEETGVLLHGRAILPGDSPLYSLPPGSCLSIKTKLLNVCSGDECPIYPVYGNTTLTDLEIENNTIPYSMQMPALDPGTYVISAVLHVGKCNDGDQTMVPGDYYNDEMHDYVVSSETTDVEKDISLVQLKDAKAGGVFVSGRVLLPKFDEVLQPGSCLTVSSRKLIQCKNNNCKIPPVATKVFENITNDGGVPYSILLPVATPGKYIISAVINNGWCKLNDLKDWIHPGDFYNMKVHDFEIKSDTPYVGKNIDVEVFNPEKPKKGVTIHGRLFLPKEFNRTLSTKSCLTIKAQEFKLCGGGINCINPLSAKETFRDFQLEDHTIPYAIVLPKLVTGHFILSAVLNVDWCKEDDVNSQEFIHNGDFHNEEIHDFVIVEGTTEIEKDVKMEEYDDIVTAAPTTDRHVPSTKAYLTSTEKPRINMNQQHSTMSLNLMPTSKPSHKFNGAVSSGTARTLKSEITTPNSEIGERKPLTDSALKSREEFIKMLVTTEQPHGNLIYDTKQPITIGVGQLYPIKSEIISEKPIQATTEPSTFINTTQTPTLNTPQLEDLITLPEGLPKSCQEIRDAGIGTLDGQYIIEARPRCHLSIICQDMNDKDRVPKEFLGGPSEAEWRYWHYAVLIKLSYEDKLNIPSGACLEKTEAGKDLIKRIIEAGAKQGNPVADWHTNISQMLSKRGKRNIHAGRTLITKAIKIYRSPKDKRSDKESNSKWGVL